MQKTIIFSSLLIGYVLCQIDLNNLDLSSAAENIPGLENFNQSALPSKDDVEKVFKEKCEKNGGPKAYDEVVNSKDVLQQCFEKYVNVTQVMEELELAKKSGSMDEVFGEYCKKRDDIIACVKSTFDKIELCLEEKEKEVLVIALNVTENLANFACFKDGDRLAMFIAEGGLECLESKKDKVQECVSKVDSLSKLPSNLSIMSLPMLVIEDKQCQEFLDLKECVVSELESCKDNTPANLVDALFKFVKNVTPCKDFVSVKPSAARLQSDDSPLAQSFSRKCYKYAGPNAYRDLEVATANMKQCVQLKLRERNVCSRLPTEIRNCTNPVINKLRVCLPPQESYIPGFAHGSIDSVLKYLCDNEASNYNKFFDAKGLKCLFLNNPRTLNDCMNSTKTRRTAENDVITKSDLCEDLDKVKLCLSTYLSNHCSEMPDFKEMTVGIMEALKAPCGACCISTNLFALLLATFMSLRLFL